MQRPSRADTPVFLACVALSLAAMSLGLLVLSAWCLGVLNSHRRFFLSYAAPVLWNLAIIGSLLAFGGCIALQLALDSPEVVHSVALLEPGLMVGASAQAYREALARRGIASRVVKVR